MKFAISIFFCFNFALQIAAQCPGPAQRNALLNLERGIVNEGTRAGQVPLTDTCGNQRYAQYTEINPTPIAYVPTATGNPSTNFSEFVTDPSGDIWYIDWQGRGLQLTGGGSTCDQDWLQISDNSCPNSLLDSIYKYKYASIGARLVWPGAELLVNDSTASAIAVIQGSRNARLALYDSGAPGTFLMIDHGGTTPVVYMPVASNLVFKTTAGTPQTPVGSQVSHFAINSQDSTIQMFQYPRTRVDTQSIVNFLYTDPVGKIRSRPAADLIAAGGGTTGSGVANRVAYWGGTTSLTSNATFTFTPSASATNPHLRVRSSATQFQPVIRADSLAADGIGFQARAFGTSGSEFNALLGVANGTTGAQDINIELQNLSTNPGAYSILELFSSGGGSVSKYRTASSTFFCGNDAGTYRMNWTGTDAFATTGFNLSSTTNNVGIGAASLGSKFYVSGSTRFDLGSDATGDIFYRAAGGNLTRLPIGSAGNVLTVSGGLPAWAASGGGGTVNSFSSGNLSPLFTTSVATATTTPALSFTLDNQTANTFLAGPTSGGAAAPTFRGIVAADINGVAFVQDGNSFGATATLGTNDANTLAFETSGTTRATLNTSGVFTVADDNAATNTVTQRFAIGSNSTGTPAAGIGPYMSFLTETSTTPNTEIARIAGRCSFITHANYAGAIDFYTSSSGSAPSSKVTIDGNGSIGVGTTSPAYRLCNTASTVTDGTAVTSAGVAWAAGSSSDTYMIGVSNTGTTSLRHGAMFEANATDNATRALTVSVGSGPTRVLTVNCDQTVGILDETPESPLDVTGLAKVNHLSGQNLTPTIAVNTGGAGTGASASMTNAQSSDLAGRFSITSGTGATTGLWATITFDDAFAVAPIVQFDCEDQDCANLRWYSNTSTTSTEFFIASGQADGTVYEINFHIIGGK